MLPIPLHCALQSTAHAQQAATYFLCCKLCCSSDASNSPCYIVQVYSNYNELFCSLLCLAPSLTSFNHINLYLIAFSDKKSIMENHKYMYQFQKSVFYIHVHVHNIASDLSPVLLPNGHHRERSVTHVEEDVALCLVALQWCVCVCMCGIDRSRPTYMYVLKNTNLQHSLKHLRKSLVPSNLKGHG